MINSPDAYTLLRDHIASFVKMSNSEWELILPALEMKAMRKNELFVQEGRRAYEVAFVTSGMFRQYYTKEGEEKTTYFFFEHHLISSYISCITGKPSLVNIEALGDATYISFPYSTLLDLFDKSMAWQKFGRLVAEYLTIGLEERMVGLLLQSPEERYLDLLGGNKSKILERIPQHYIANYLGITPVSMSRIRNRVLKK